MKHEIYGHEKTIFKIFLSKEYQYYSTEKQILYLQKNLSNIHFKTFIDIDLYLYIYYYFDKAHRNRKT